MKRLLNSLVIMSMLLALVSCNQSGESSSSASQEAGSLTIEGSGE